jgi:hypothetical protein
MIRLTLRILVILSAIGIVAAMVWLVVIAFPGSHQGFGRRPFLRHLRPQPGAVIVYFGKLILIGSIAWLGRRFLKLRL